MLWAWLVPGPLPLNQIENVSFVFSCQTLSRHVMHRKWRTKTQLVLQKNPPNMYLSYYCFYQQNKYRWRVMHFFFSASSKRHPPKKDISEWIFKRFSDKEISFWQVYSQAIEMLLSEHKFRLWKTFQFEKWRFAFFCFTKPFVEFASLENVFSTRVHLTVDTLKRFTCDSDRPTSILRNQSVWVLEMSKLYSFSRCVTYSNYCHGDGHQVRVTLTAYVKLSFNNLWIKYKFFLTTFQTDSSCFFCFFAQTFTDMSQVTTTTLFNQVKRRVHCACT